MMVLLSITKRILLLRDFVNTMALDIFNCKRFCKPKHNDDGSIEHYKARHVDKGFFQLHGIGYGNTPILFVKPTIMRIFIV